MRKSNAENLRAFRDRAKARGDCSTCGKRKPKPGRDTCRRCLKNAATVVKRTRENAKKGEP